MTKPYIYIMIGDDEKVTVYDGEVFYLFISISNPDSVEDIYYNEDIDMEINRIKESFEKGEIDEEEYREMVEELEAKKLKVEAIELGDMETPWTQQIEIMLMKNNEWVRCPWNFVEVFKSPPDNTVKLIGDTSAMVRYVLTPEDVAKIEPGEHRLMARIGETSSNEVVIEKVKGAREEFDENAIERTATYYIESGNYKEAYSLIDKILSIDPNSIGGLMLLSEYLSRQGRIKEALETMLKAREIFYQKYPDLYEPPVLIERRITELMAELSEEDIT